MMLGYQVVQEMAQMKLDSMELQQKKLNSHEVQ